MVSHMDFAEVKHDHDNSQCASEMPVYRSHKEVWALKIREIRREKEGVILYFEDGHFAAMPILNRDLENKPNPQDGWYMVVYKGGYQSFSPAQEFEEGYTKL